MSVTNRTTAVVAAFGLASCLALTACGDTSQFTRTVQGFTKKVESFTAHNESQNGLFNTSRVTMTGSYALGTLAIAADESRLLTPVQLKQARDAVRLGGTFATEDHDDSKIAYWIGVERDFKQFTTDNEVLVFRIQNKGYDPIDLGQAHFLLLNPDGTRKPQMTLSADSRDLLDRDAHFVAGPDNQVVQYASDGLGVVPALTTVYRAVIIPGMNQGAYTAMLLHVPGAAGKAPGGRLTFAVQKR
jgi:hypothetical protein